MKNPLVVGYKGEIGSFILQGLLKIMPKALNIWCIDVNETEEEVIHRIIKADIIFLCVPLQSTIDWLLKYKSLLKDKTIIEQCSLKEWLYEDKRLENLNLISMHIMFRPSQTPNFEDRKVIMFEDQLIKKFEFKKSKIVFVKDAKEHDKKMAIQQALLHRTLLILEKMLDDENSTYISKKVTELGLRIRGGNKDLYRMIQDNKYVPEALWEFRKNFDEFDMNNVYFWKK